MLSFSLQEGLGEILICKKIAQKKKNPILFLVIHAVLHLKGMEHSSKMEAYERAYYNRYRCGTYEVRVVVAQQGAENFCQLF